MQKNLAWSDVSAYGSAFKQEDIVETISRLNEAVFALQTSSNLCQLRTCSRVSFIATSLVDISLQQREITKTFIEREKEVNFAALLNRISDEETREFIRNIVGQLLENDPTKTALDVWKINIGSDGFAILVKALEKNCYLEILKLSCNPIGDEDVAILAKVMKNNQSLQILDLSHNSISDKGVAMLAEALRENKTLQSLNLSENRISDEGVKALVQALKGNRSLYFLNLSYNDIRNTGVEALLKLLKRNLIVFSLAPFSMQGAVGSMAIQWEKRRRLSQFGMINRDIVWDLYQGSRTVEAITKKLQDLKQELYPLDEFFSVAIELASTRCSDYTEKAVEDFETYVSCLHELMQQITILEGMIVWHNRLACCYSGGALSEKRKQVIERLPNYLQNLLISEFEDILSVICSKYYHLYYKRDAALFNAPNFDMARDIYKFWTRIFGEECSKWIDNKAPQLITFYQLCALAEGQKEEPGTCCPPSVLLAKLKVISEQKRLPEIQSQEWEVKKRRRLE